MCFNEAEFEHFFKEHQNKGLDTYSRLLREFAKQQGGLWLTALQPQDRREFRLRARALYIWQSNKIYQEFHLAQLEEGQFSYWVYRVFECQLHASFDRIAFPPTHPFWKTYTPANGWFCKCRLTGCRSIADVSRAGGDPGKELPGDWDATDAHGFSKSVPVAFSGRKHPSIHESLVALVDGLHHEEP
jgi:hypothetical protein